MNLPYYIARHLYKDGGRSQNVSRPSVRIATLGIAVGVAVMIISVCVVLGFKHTVRDKIVGFNSHIIVSNYMTLQTSDQSQSVNANDSLVSVLRKTEGVKHVQRYSLKQGVLKTDADFLGVMFKGVGEDFDTSFVAGNLVEGRLPQFCSDKSARQIVVSKTMADKLRLRIGSKVYAYFLSDDDVRARSFNVAAIYQSNMSRYDESFCFTDLYTVSKLNGWTCDGDSGRCEVSGLELAVNDFDSLLNVEDHIIDHVNKTHDSDGNTLSSLTVYEMSPQTFSWLDLLDLNVWIILALMVCVAGVTIVSGLLIIILERTSMIGLLKALGARNSLVRRTFRWLAFFIVVKGMLLGNVLGIGLCLIQKYFGLVKLDPSVYYVSEAPVEINIPLIVLLNVATLIITVLVLVLPSYFVSTINPARSMRIE
ncbi:MAG: ABC transporter permease [Prevotella sp.]|nr:ABC transporter permease [Prevotella sp.]